MAEQMFGVYQQQVSRKSLDGSPDAMREGVPSMRQAFDDIEHLEKECQVRLWQLCARDTTNDLQPCPQPRIGNIRFHLGRRLATVTARRGHGR